MQESDVSKTPAKQALTTKPAKPPVSAKAAVKGTAKAAAKPAAKAAPKTARTAASQKPQATAAEPAKAKPAAAAKVLATAEVQESVLAGDVEESVAVQAPPPVVKSRASRSTRPAPPSPPAAPLPPATSRFADRFAPPRPPTRQMNNLAVDTPKHAHKADPKLANAWKAKAGRDLSEAELMAMPESEYMNDKQLEFFREVGDRDPAIRIRRAVHQHSQRVIGVVGKSHEGSTSSWLFPFSPETI